MCGICGEYRQGGADPETLRRMARAIAHRGPDDEGFFLRGPVGLGSRRLSIIDVQGGHQPISNEDGSVWIVFNGEIYNFRSLRRDLETKGHTFATHTDTEVIVHLYEERGEECVQQLDGMFAFAIYDDRRRRLFLARDRLGQKPLFYAWTGECLRFASEIKALLAPNDQRVELDLESMHHYLSLRFVPPPRTMLRHIRKLPPAHTLVFESGEPRVSRYWHLSFAERLDQPEEELLELLRESLEGSVESHLVSDVPIGALLSGGMDSSVIVALIARIRSAPFQTFSIGVKEQDFNELPYARLVAERYATEHVEESVEADVIGRLPHMIAHLDEPSDPIAPCMSRAAELAARHVKVVLGGDGGDELFAGFDRYLGVQRIELYNRLPSLLRERLIRPLIHLVPENLAYKSLSQRLRWVDRLSSLPNLAQRYADATCFFRFSHEQKRSLLTEPIWREVAELDSARAIVEPFESADAADALGRMLYADFMTRLPEHSLMLTDRMSMAHGLEMRSPFLDHRLVELAASIPSELKIRRGTLKYALRRLAERILPREIVRRPKQGFMFPIAYWFRDRLQSFTRDFLLRSQIVRDEVVRAQSVTRLLDEHRRRRIDNHVRIWMLLNLELWYRMYPGGESPQDLADELREGLR